MAKFYQSPKDKRYYLSFGGAEYRIGDVEDDNGGKELHCKNANGKNFVFICKGNKVRMTHKGE